VVFFVLPGAAVVAVFDLLFRHIETVKASKLQRHIFIDRAGMRLLF